MQKRQFFIFGSTSSSVGTQAINAIRTYSELLVAEINIAQVNHQLVIKQVLGFLLNADVIGDISRYNDVKTALAYTTALPRQER